MTGVGLEPTTNGLTYLIGFHRLPYAARTYIQKPSLMPAILPVSPSNLGEHGAMGRVAKVRQKGDYWTSDAGGKTTYFGKVAEVSHAEATQRLHAHLAEAKTLVPPAPNPNPTLTLDGLRTKYLAWLKRHRSALLHREAQRHLQRFADAYGDIPAVEIKASHLEAFQDVLRASDHAPLYVKKHATSVRAMFNRGVRQGWLPPDCKPFVHVEHIRLDPKPLLETDLPSDAEVQALCQHAKPGLAGMLRVYHATGARTHELCNARVGDFQANARTIVLGKHKRSKTLREPIPRTITLNDTAYAILAKRCEGHAMDAPIFPNRAGKPFTSCLIGDMFARLRDRVGVRQSITIYSLRHLWISDMLQAGVDVLLVARMAGTSVKMVEQVYGHFRTQSFQDAQARLDALRQCRQ